MPPLNTDTNAAALVSTPAKASAPSVAAPTVIRANAGEPWPEPPHGGTWSRDPKTGDLTLIEPSAAMPVHDRREAPKE